MCTYVCVCACVCVRESAWDGGGRVDTYTPMTQSLLSEALDEDALTEKRKRWLQAHDQKTGGIMGLLPLVKGLPVRLTDHVDRGLGLFKNSKCTIHGWTLHESEAASSLFLFARLL